MTAANRTAANNQRSITLPPLGRTKLPYGLPNVESRFRMKKGLEEGDRFDHTVAVAALSMEVIQLCFNAIAHPDDNEPFSRQKDALLQ